MPNALLIADVLLTAGAQCVLSVGVVRSVGVASADAVDNASFLTELCRIVDRVGLLELEVFNKALLERLAGRIAFVLQTPFSEEQ